MAVTDEERSRFIEALDKAEVSLTDFEVKFVASIIDRNITSFSTNRAKCIDGMMEQYGDKVDW